MDLSDLLKPERIRCQCNVQSKKRTLQTLAELLGESLRTNIESAAACDDPEGGLSQASEGDSRQESLGEKINDALGGARRAKLARKPNDKSDGSADSLSDMEILDALISRERLGSTGLGHGVALPHSRMIGIKEPIAAFVTLEQGVDYESVDGQKVDLVLGLLVPEDCNDEHLKILAQLARRFSDEPLRAALRAFKDPDELYRHFVALAPTSESGGKPSELSTDKPVHD